MECETSPYANLIPGTLGKADCQCFDTIVSNLNIISVRCCSGASTEKKILWFLLKSQSLGIPN